ncbi:MAG: OmpA family protein [Thermoanaerobaculia bacterium]
MHELHAFGTDSAELTAEHQAIIQQVADQLNAEPLLLGSYVTIVGHADRRGTDEHNRQLGQRRADAVRDRLMELVTDEATRNQIRAYSLGEPAEGPSGDTPELRRVTITITQRGLDIHLPAPSARLTPLPPHPTGTGLQPILQPTLPGGPGPNLPPWFWQELPTTPPPAPFLNRLSRWLTGVIGREDIARITGELAAGVGFDQNRVRRALDEAMVSGGEEGLKRLLRAMFEALAGPPAGRPDSPYGPPVQEVPRPPILQLPPIPLPYPFR